MHRVKDILVEVEKLAPPQYAFKWDKIGLQIGDPNAPVTRVAVSLDSSMGAAEFAQANGCQLLISHHPVIWEPLTGLKERNHAETVAAYLTRHGISFIAAHTNWDCAIGGINDVLAQKLGLQEVSTFGSGADIGSFKMVTYVPVAHVDQVIDAASQAGAGQIGAYSRCAFFHSGHGTFLGDLSTNPAIGTPGKREQVDEHRIEMDVPVGRESEVYAAISAVHPYEEPVIDFLAKSTKVMARAGRLGSLPNDQTPSEFQQVVDRVLDCRSQLWLSSDEPIRKVAVVGGAAASEWKAALAAGAGILVTGEVQHHIALEATESGLTMMAAGHYHTEQPGIVELALRLRGTLSLDVIVFEPEPGKFARHL